MSASPADFFRGGLPPPRASLLPDSVFFARTVAVAPGTPRAEVAGLVGLALEGQSPFPLAQMYHGFYWPDGADRALAFAAYRRRFTADQLEEWDGADHVLPAFAAILGIEAAPATTAILTSAAGLTCVRWDKGPVPASVAYRPLPPEATDADRAAARADLIRSAGEAARVLDLPSPPTVMAGGSDGDLVAESGGLRSFIPAAAAASLDVRDKGDLAAIARDHGRGILLWRAAIGAAAACAACALIQLGLLGAGLWQKARIAKVAAQKSTVAHIMEEQELAGRIDELSTKRLLPLEMISAASPEVAVPKNPPAIQFIHASASTLDTIEITAQTSNAGEIPGYKTALERSPGIDRVEIQDQRARDNVVTFKLIVTFKPGALTPAAT
ncbi:MAG TPA: hypothetical protein VGG34_13925 [Opitutaceae bacterium]|jgi:hypothetical protein